MKVAAIRSWARYRGWTDFLGGYRTPKPPRAMPHPLPEGPNGVLLMIEAAANDRQRALAVFCGLLGLRVAEARSVTPEQIDTHDMTLYVLGKGSKWRIIPISELAWVYLAPLYEASTPGVAFVNLSDRGARKAVTTMAERAALARPVASHDLRATVGTAAYDRTKDLRAVQELLGHSSSKTTEVYTGISMDAMRKAVNIA